MGRNSRKTLRFAISSFKKVVNCSDLDPGQKAEATKHFAAFVRAMSRKDARSASEYLNACLRMFVRKH